ncbi:putative non-specific serine/threonine protein kinase [Medicago truncatula]|nr:putative non-specific serine/threonine protein kinase [Medicago truncatula]
MHDRNHSIDLNSAVLSLDYSGVLKIESQNRKPIIIYSSPQPINNTLATILDTGNFVLQQFHPNGSKTVLWQSFDYPSDVLIPTMKLGVNQKTGHNWSLVSWLTPSLPTTTTIMTFSNT